MEVKRTPLKGPINGSRKWVLLIIVIIAGFSSQAGSNYQVRKSVIAGGEPAASTNYKVQTAIGQPVIQYSTGGSYEFSPGFYQQNRDLIFADQFETNNLN